MVGGGSNIAGIYYGNIRSIKAMAKKVCFFEALPHHENMSL